ncbi:beta-lactamase family protein [Flavobacteriaceae bacterium S0825]|uniref:serine hydrolase domain-containing protein n=1 Tax=Gaetbulibacter sp. S0825 TaxID=2720084 RepID=UPI001431ED64|nr:serine hydrolase [Gaetbulibacter sp. S0825]MCK0110082.1 beta-lactamase family protein [Flavobacteriaceae bacterium S0825]NIX65711.1 serine hydrolase [Gaetbulibacter sp. S0825]
MIIKKLYSFLIISIVLLNNYTYSQNPNKHWKKYKHIEQSGFSKEKLASAKTYYDSLKSSAFLVIQNGKIVANWGDINRRFIIHSTRKGILNSLYGIYSENGTIDLNTTIGELGITDKDSLSELEKSAKIIHLLKARSGIYHKAAAEPSWVDDYRPKRSSVQPDSLWFYNNWDFNVLGTIFEQLTNTSIYEALHNDVAIPLQMQDYRIMDGEYFYEKEYSNHPAYHLKMSARDLARYGQLFLQQGLWNDNQIFSKKWVTNSTYPTSKHGGGDKIGRWYGWLWGVSEYYSDYKMFFASGTGGQIVAIFPNDNLIIVNLCNTYQKDKITSKETIKLFDLILEAKIDKSINNPELITIKTRPRTPEKLYQQKLDNAKYVGDYIIDGKKVSIIELNSHLIIKDYYMKLKLLPISQNRFFVEDIEKYLNIELDNNGFAKKLYYD